jgi:hypothetical protein
MREAGLGRFEVRAPVADKPLIREIARRLAQGDAELRREIGKKLNAPGDTPTKGRILAALRNSPLVGADVSFEREVLPGRDIDL